MELAIGLELFGSRVGGSASAPGGPTGARPRAVQGIHGLHRWGDLAHFAQLALQFALQVDFHVADVAAFAQSPTLQQCIRIVRDQRLRVVVGDRFRRVERVMTGFQVFVQQIGVEQFESIGVDSAPVSLFLCISLEFILIRVQSHFLVQVRDFFDFFCIYIDFPQQIESVHLSCSCFRIK